MCGNDLFFSFVSILYVYAFKIQQDQKKKTKLKTCYMYILRINIYYAIYYMRGFCFKSIKIILLYFDSLFFDFEGYVSRCKKLVYKKYLDF